MKEPIQEIADWLRDAHAMESILVNMLEGQIARLADYPDLQQGIAAHADESKTHALLVEDALKSIGKDTSFIKDGIEKFTGMVSPVGVGMASDAPAWFHGVSKLESKRFSYVSFLDTGTSVFHTRLSNNMVYTP